MANQLDTKGGGALAGLRSGLSGASGGARLANPDDPPVYVGTRTGYAANQRFRDAVIQNAGTKKSGTKKTSTNEYKPKSALQAEFYDWASDPQKLREWGEYLAEVGRIDPRDVNNFEKLRDEWVIAVEEAARFTATGKKITPHDAARLLGGAEGASGNDPFTGVKTHRNIDLTNPEDARALLTNVLTERLGRAPNPDEIQAFTQTLTAAEQANPVVTTNRYEQGDLVETMTQGGVSQAGAQQMASDQAMATPEYGAYQAAAFYAPLLFNAISAPV